jgi:hypothetical protein
MLGAGQKVLIHHTSFQSEIGGKAEITVNLTIGGLYVLFLASRIVENKTVEIKGDVAGGEGCQRDLRFLQKLD